MVSMVMHDTHYQFYQASITILMASTLLGLAS